jgi:type IV pilus assembly protein PilE
MAIRAPHPRRARGFTLTELMVTIGIATVLAAIALPSYMGSVRKSRRTEARTALLDLATRAERFYSTTNSYLDASNALTPADLGYAGGWPISVGSGYYTVNVVATATTVAFTATAAGSQTADTQCNQFSVNETGAQSALDSSGNTTTDTCWN